MLQAMSMDQVVNLLGAEDKNPPQPTVEIAQDIAGGGATSLKVAMDFLRAWPTKDRASMADRLIMLGAPSQIVFKALDNVNNKFCVGTTCAPKWLSYSGGALVLGLAAWGIIRAARK